MENNNTKQSYTKEEILSKVPIKQALWKLSLPAIIGMMVGALYNIIDTIYIGQGIGPYAIGGLSIVFPLQMVLNSVAIMIGVGSASIISRALGAGNRERANKTAANAMLSIIVIGAVFITLGIIFINELLDLLGATPANINFAYNYLIIILYGNIFGMFSAGVNNIIRAEGRATMAMISMLIGVGLNIILDPIFIFVFNMGVRGAAIATITSQLCSSLFIIFYFIFGKHSYTFTIRSFIPNFKLIGEILYIGFPNFVRQAGTSILAIVLNNLLYKYGGDISLNTYGVINKLTMFFIFPSLGIMQGMQPILGYAYGAKNFERCKQVLKYSTIYVFIYMFVVWLLFEIFAKYAMMMFTKDTQVITMGITALRYIFAVFPLVTLNMVGSSAYQSLGFGLRAVLLALLRQTILLLPLILILPKTFGINGIWVSFPIADFLASIISGLMLLYIIKRFKKMDKKQSLA